MDKYIKGHYRRSIYSSETGYIVGIFKVSETNNNELDDYIDRTITFTGHFHELNENDTYIFYGTLEEHSKYGDQFVVTAYERCQPETKDALVEFLTSGLFKGIGERKAEKIVHVLGKETIDTILNNPDNLLLIPTVTKKNIDVLHVGMMNYQASYQILIDLNRLGFNTKDALSIYNKYQSNVFEVIDKNIYTIIEEVLNMPFKKIDHIALQMGIEKQDTRRIEAGIIYVLEELVNTTGNCYFKLNEIHNYLQRALLINTTINEIETSVNNLLKDLRLIQKEEKIYLKETYEAETNIVNRFKLLYKSTIEKQKEKNYSKHLTSVSNNLEYLENSLKITYNQDQTKAIKEAYNNDILVITGGPGTGKTTILKAIVEMYRLVNDLNYGKSVDELVLLAPTGRASKRMNESTLYPASTIHRFLKWNKDTNKFSVNENNKSDAKCVVIDEASMVDVYLLDNLLKGLSYKCKIILVGDYEQLPSVGPGQVLKDIIDSDKLPIVHLKELYRQKADSNILTLAYDINKEVVDYSCFNNEEDLTLIETTSQNLKKELRELCENYLDYDYRYFQILAPMYKTMNGIDSLNKMLQEVFNPKKTNKKELVVGEITYRENDKVIQLANMPDENVFNGDIGIISKINTQPKEIYIDFDGNEVRYTPANFIKFKHGFAISVHKAQGSEFDIVIMPILEEYKRMLYKKLIYTGITRSKKQLYILGQKSALTSSSKNNYSDSRRTTIKELLINSIKEEN